jgi:hypothetical protein
MREAATVVMGVRVPAAEVCLDMVSPFSEAAGLATWRTVDRALNQVVRADGEKKSENGEAT